MFLLAWTRMLAGIWQNNKTVQIRLNLWIYKPQATLCTWPAGVGEEVRDLTTHSFSFWHPAITLSLPLQGAGRSHWSLYSGSGLAKRSSGLQKNCFSLWHMLRHDRRSIISLSLFILSCSLLCRSLLSDLSSQGLVKSPGKDHSKHWTELMSPVSHKLLQTFFVSLKWRVHWKEVHVFVPKGQWLLNLLQSYKARQFNINLSSSKFFWAMDVWFNLLNMLKPLFFDGCAFFISCT